MTTRARSRRRQPAVDELLFQCRAVGMLAPVCELKFHKTRRWRFDLAFRLYAKPVSENSLSELVNLKLAIEIDGGGFVQGRHGRGLGIEKDCEKYAEAMLLGWRVLRVTPRQVKTGQALQWIQALLT